MAQEAMYAAFARVVGADMPFQHVTLSRQLFFANKGLTEALIEASKEKHPEWEFRMEEVNALKNA